MPTERITKKCRACGHDFMPSPSRIKRYNWICNDCDYRRNPRSGTRMPREYHRQYEAEWRDRPGVRERLAELARTRRTDPVEAEKGRARRQVRSAIESGALQRGCCEICALESTDAHHHDYSRPLDVRWLCRQHHADEHAKARGES